MWPFEFGILAKRRKDRAGDKAAVALAEFRLVPDVTIKDIVAQTAELRTASYTVVLGIWLSGARLRTPTQPTSSS
jgi:hypothetical protein